MRLLTCVILLFITCCAHAQQQACFRTTADSSLTIESNIDFTGYNAFLVGEYHGVYGVPEIKLALIKYLNRTYGITDVFMEIGYSAASLYNAYLATGDTGYFTAPEILYSQKNPNRDFWYRLYTYNKGLEHKITIRGIDFERGEFLKVLRWLSPKDKEKPALIADILMLIDTVSVPKVTELNSASFKYQNMIYRRISEEMKKNETLFKLYYGANFRMISDIVFNPATYHSYSGREKAMYLNIEKQIERDDIKKFVVFTGIKHADNAKATGLPMLLSNTHVLKNKLVNIAMICKNCYDWQLKPEYRTAAFRAPYTYLEDTALLNSIYTRHYETSCKYIMFPVDSVDDDKVQRYSDYILLMKNQPEF